MQTTTTLRNHANYNADDYAYLTAKGWTAAEILKRWNQEAATGNGPCKWDTATARSKLAAVTQQTNYDEFIRKLTALTQKYGVAIQSVGGVLLAQRTGEFRDVTYVADSSSGDLYPDFHEG